MRPMLSALLTVTIISCLVWIAAGVSRGADALTEILTQLTETDEDAAEPELTPAGSDQ